MSGLRLKIIFLTLSLAPLIFITPALNGGKESIPSNGHSSFSQDAWTVGNVYFIANEGQFSPPTEFAIQDHQKTILFAAHEVAFLLPGEAAPWAVKMRFLKSQGERGPVPEGQRKAAFSYFKGPRHQWKTAIPAYSQVRYPDLWPGIDLVYSSSTEGLKSEFIIRPGANPDDIRVAIEGAETLIVDQAGQLVMTTARATIIEKAPMAYQLVEGRKVEIKSSYRLEGAPLGHGRQPRSDPGSKGREAFVYSFSLGPYDSSRELILDPVIMVAGSYIGGPGFDYVYGLALDKAGAVYIAGFTYSASSFPLRAGPQLIFNGGDVDAYIAKIDPVSSALLYCGFIGGADKDFAYDVAVDDSGHAYVTGYTSSTETSFPVFKGPDLTANGRSDAFIAKVTPAGTSLVYCGFLGGADNDYGRGIAVDSEGRPLVTGYSLSGAQTFPVRTGPFLANAGNSDAFIARVNVSGEELEYCGFVGGPGEEYAYGLAVDSEGAAYIAGSTTSTETFFPVLSGPDLSFNGATDAFVAKVKPAGEGLVYCGYIGGDREDVASAITVDVTGAAYLTGYTASDESSFPRATGPDLSYNGGFYDAFVAKVWVDGSSLAYCGYIGGQGYDVGSGLALDDWGCAYVTGYTSSLADSFPVKEGPDLLSKGSFDAFLGKVTWEGKKLDFCGYFGGAFADIGQEVVVEKTGTGIVYVAGTTHSPDIAFPALLPPGSSFQGKRDIFLARYAETSITLTSPNGGELWYSGLTQNITWRTVGVVGPVRLEFSPDEGTTWETITAETENDGQFAWVVPDVSSTACLVRVSEAEDGIPTDTSDLVFSISHTPVILVTSPNGGEAWPVGSTQKLTWRTGSAPVGDVRIEYTTDAGSTWLDIAGRTENDGLYEWSVPDTPSSDCLMRISKADEADPVDRSDAPFSIVTSASSTNDSTGTRKQAEEVRPVRKGVGKRPGKKNIGGGGAS